MPLLSTIGAAAARAFGFLRSLVSGFNVGNSLRFNSGSSDYLNRTPSSTTNQRTYTISCWYKRTNTGLQSAIIGVNPAGASFFSISIDASGTYANKLGIYWYDGTTDYGYYSDRVFRDFSAWYHIVIAVDTTQATAGDRLKVYINGIQETLTAVYGSFTQNLDTYYNSNVIHYIGASGETGTSALNGYLSEFYSIDGQALTPSSFGQTDSTTGIWTPIDYTGTYGTNGFYLNFANSADLGNDVSGNNNDWTVNNLTSVDQSTDTPTNNFNTLNPLIPLGSNFSAPTEGNLSLSQSGTGNSGFFASTIIPSAGKWYFEVKTTAVSSSDRTNIGIANFESVTGTNSIEAGDYKGISVSTGTTGRIAVTNGATTTEFDVAGYVPVANDIMIFAVDMDNSRVYVGKNGTWFTTSAASGGNPATSTGYFSPVLGNGFAVGAGHGAGVSVSATNLYNFGNPPFTISSGNADANGFGNFEYAVPSGYYALCTKNLTYYG